MSKVLWITKGAYVENISYIEDDIDKSTGKRLWMFKVHLIFSRIELKRIISLNKKKLIQYDKILLSNGEEIELSSFHNFNIDEFEEVEDV